MKISIIIASYNYADLISKAIESVLAQTYKNWELIIVDDGSRDNSLDVIKRYSNKYDNVYLYTHPNNVNRGLKETIKLGLQKATGRYVAFCESDDYWENNYLEEKMNVLNKFPQVKFIFNEVKVFGDKKSIDMDKYFANRERILKRKHWPSNIVSYFASINLVTTFSCVFVEKDALLECNFDTPINTFLDGWLWTQLCYKHKAYYVDKKLTNWRQHSKSYSSSSSEIFDEVKQKEFIDKILKTIGRKWRVLDFHKLWRFYLYQFFGIPRINKIFRGLIKLFFPYF